MPADQLYDVTMAFLAREAEKPGPVHENVNRVLDSVFPLPVVEQTRTEDGVLEHNPEMEIPGWGFSDVPDFAMAQGPASAGRPASEGDWPT